MTARSVFQESCRAFAEGFPAILAIVSIFCIPLELLSSYMDAFVFGPEDWSGSLRFQLLLTNTIGLFATAGVIHVALQRLTRQRVRLSTALDAAVRSWGRLFATMILWGLAISAGLFLLVIPGLYLLVRFSLAQPVTIHERSTPAEALRRSFTLTKGHFWPLLRIGLVVYALFIVAAILVSLPTAFIPAFQHWVFNAALTWITEIMFAFVNVIFTAIYLELKEDEGGRSPQQEVPSVDVPQL